MREAIRYAASGIQFRGELIYDESVKSRRPALLVAPNFLGVTDAAVEQGRMLAGDRYVALVADLYGESTRPAGMEQAAALSNPIKANPGEARSRMNAALNALTSAGERRGIIDSRRRAAIGFCFGGGNVLELARSGADIAAAISVHGDLASFKPAGPKQIKAAVLALHGSKDPIVPRSQLEAFLAEMDSSGAKWKLVVFGGLVHAFTEPGANVPGMAKYDEPASRQTWSLVHEFLADAFAGRL